VKPELNFSRAWQGNARQRAALVPRISFRSDKICERAQCAARAGRIIFFERLRLSRRPARAAISEATSDIGHYLR